MSHERVDVCVVGAGPAGSSTALHLRRMRPDLAVVLLDRHRFPRDKVCGDAISPDGVSELERLGALDAVDGYAPVRAVRVRSAGGREVAAAPPRDGYVVPRAVFDVRLLERAVAAGTEFRQDRLRRLEPVRGGFLVNGSVTAGIVVGADGAHSTVRRLLRIAPNAPAHTMIALRGYSAGGYGRELFLAWDAQRAPAYAWSFPVDDTLTNVGFGLPLSRLTGGRRELERRLREGLGEVRCKPGSLKAAHLPLSSGRPVPHRGRALLVGDAASLVNPLTGEGIFYALASGRIAAEAVASVPDDPGPCYGTLLRRTFARHFRHTRLLAAASRWRGVTDLLVTAAADPAVLDGVAEIAFGKGVITPRLGLRVARASLARR